MNNVIEFEPFKKHPRLIKRLREIKYTKIEAINSGCESEMKYHLRRLNYDFVFIENYLKKSPRIRSSDKPLIIIQDAVKRSYIEIWSALYDTEAVYYDQGLPQTFE